jgi:hypothetical protein
MLPGNITRQTATFNTFTGDDRRVVQCALAGDQGDGDILIRRIFSQPI